MNSHILSSLVLLLAILTLLVARSQGQDIDQEDASTAFLCSKDRLGKLRNYRDVPKKCTCEKYPQVCELAGSPGHYCCKKKCVDLFNDNFNCWGCGIRCKGGKSCCGGTCTDTRFDEKNCGGCGKRCANGALCTYGMCGYSD
ncbi:hypothetical protein Droror1_Dr00020557 [Drosera rotundifolia]